MLDATDARKLLDSIDTARVIGLRDRAVIGLMVYSFARVSAVIGMKTLATIEFIKPNFFVSFHGFFVIQTAC